MTIYGPQFSFPSTTCLILLQPYCKARMKDFKIYSTIRVVEDGSVSPGYNRLKLYYKAGTQPYHMYAGQAGISSGSHIYQPLVQYWSGGQGLADNGHPYNLVKKMQLSPPQYYIDLTSNPTSNCHSKPVHHLTRAESQQFIYANKEHCEF